MSESEPLREYPGLGRLNYFLAHVGMIVGVMLAVMIFGPDSNVMKYLGLPLMIAGLVLDVMRLRNTGLSQWFAFVRFVPFGSTLLGIFLFSAQPGWVETRRWDSVGVRILAVEVFLLVLLLLAFLRFGASATDVLWDLAS